MVAAAVHRVISHEAVAPALICGAAERIKPSKGVITTIIGIAPEGIKSCEAVLLSKRIAVLHAKGAVLRHGVK